MLAQAMTLTPSREQRAWPRYLLKEAVPLTLRVGTRAIECQLEDISLGGAKLRVDDDLTPLSQMTLVHSKFGAFKSDRLWERPGYIGIEFDHSEAPLELIAHCLSSAAAPGLADAG